MSRLFTRTSETKQEKHAGKVAHCHKILEHIQDQGERLQQIAEALPADEAAELCDKIELLLETADEMLENVERLEQRQGKLA